MQNTEDNRTLPSGKIANSSRDFHFYALTKLHYDSSGVLRSFTPLMSNEEWAPFLEHFDNVKIFARIDEKNVDDNGYRLNLPGLEVIPMPYYEGVLEYIKNYRKIRAFLSDSIVNSQVYYGLWAPSQFSRIVASFAKRIKAPLLVRLIGDPRGVANTVFPWPLNKFATFFAWQSTKKTVELADAVIYVTLRTLQTTYPATADAITLARTNVKFGNSLGALPKKSYKELERQAEFSLVAVGSQQQNYKGHDLLISAAGKLQEAGYQIKLTLVGSGRLHTTLKDQADTFPGLRVNFIERLGTTHDVAAELSKHDIFVMPSRTEGMPKALLEAMYMGVFSLGSRVGGIPEILPEQCLFDSNSVESIFNTISKYIDEPERMLSQIGEQQLIVRDIELKHSGSLILDKFLGDWISVIEMKIK